MSLKHAAFCDVLGEKNTTLSKGSSIHYRTNKYMALQNVNIFKYELKPYLLEYKNENKKIIILLW